jgi:hypothetical protein
MLGVQGAEGSMGACRALAAGSSASAAAAPSRPPLGLRALPAPTAVADDRRLSGVAEGCCGAATPARSARLLKELCGIAAPGCEEVWP